MARIIHDLKVVSTILVQFDKGVDLFTPLGMTVIIWDLELFYFVIVDIFKNALESTKLERHGKLWILGFPGDKQDIHFVERRGCIIV